MNSYTCACGKIRGELKKTNWTRHLQSCGKKRKLSNCNHTSVTNTNTTITSFFKPPVNTSSTKTHPLPTRRTGMLLNF